MIVPVTVMGAVTVITPVTAVAVTGREVGHAFGSGGRSSSSAA
jgi:hypothetical protein